MGVLAAPHLLVSWGATSLGADFGGYGIFVRETRAVPGPWQREAYHGVPPGRRPATVEANETVHLLYRLGWHNPGVSESGRHTDGWDVAVAAYNWRTKRWTSVHPASLTAKVVTGDSHPWLVCEEWPFLNFALDRTEVVAVGDRSRRSDFEVHGRGLTTAVTRLELPARDYEIRRRSYTPAGEDGLRYLRALAASGKQVCLHLPLGDRVLGVVDAPSKVEHSDKFYLDTTFSMVETARPSAGIAQTVAPSNVPCGTVLDGTNDYWRVADANALDPSSSAFSVSVACVPPNPDPYVTFPGTSGDYASTPDNAAWTVSGTLRLVARVRASDYTPASDVVVIGQWDTATNNRGYLLRVSTAGALRFFCSAAGSANTVDQSSSAPSFTDGEDYWIGAEYVTGTGALAFYKAADNGSNVPPSIWSGWTLVSSHTVTATTPFNSNQPLSVGAQESGGTGNRFTGRIYRAMVYDDGVLVADFNPGDAASTSATSWTARASTTGETWTLNGGDPTINDVDRYLLSKGNPGVADGYAIKATSNGVVAVVDGATTKAILEATDTDWDSTWYADPRGHVFTLVSSGTAQTLYVDGVAVATASVTHGSVSNAVALNAGALNAGASNFAAGKMIALAYHPEALTDAEAQAAAYWLRGYPGYRMPPSAAVYIDTRYGPDLGGVGGCWNGIGALLKDLSGNRRHATVIGSPPTQGNVWPLSIVERFG